MKRLLLLISICVLMTGFPATCFAGTHQQTLDTAISGVKGYIRNFATVQAAKSKDIHKKSAKKKTVMKSKTVYYKNASGKVMWSVRVTGTFAFKNKTAKCIRAKVTATSKDKSWVITSKSAYTKGNQAIAKATGKHYLSKKKAETFTKTVVLTASPSGRFS